MKIVKNFIDYIFRKGTHANATGHDVLIWIYSLALLIGGMFAGVYLILTIMTGKFPGT